MSKPAVANRQNMTRAAERRRRERHFRRRRRDLLQDVGIALLLAIILVSVTAGLGVLVLLEVPIAAGLIGSSLAERVLGKRRARPRRGAQRARS
jgi:hypothetical protein